MRPSWRPAGPHEFAQERPRILEQLVLAERGLADEGMHVGTLVHAEFDLARLELLHRLRDVERHGAALGVRHQPARSEHATELADLTHHVRGGDDGIHVQPALLDLLDELVGTDVVGPAASASFTLSPCQHEHPQALAGAVRQDHRAADQLVRCRGSTPRCDETTMVSSNFARAVCLTSRTASARSRT